MSRNTKLLVIIAGPTAVGKTDLGIQLAQHFDTEIISADSRQFYRELSIGTAKPTAEEMQGVVHHFINSHSITELYSAGHFERDALTCIAKIHEQKNIVFVVGGSGLYIKALCEGLDDIPETPITLRNELMERLHNEGIKGLQERLLLLDPDFYHQNDINNSQRVVRALEVTINTGVPFSSFKIKNNTKRPFDILQIAINRPRELLYERINQRVDAMIEQGLIDEVKNVISYRSHNALQTVGYNEVFAYLDGNLSKNEMIELIKRNTRRYAKRQLTWFRHQGNFIFFENYQTNEIVKFIGNQYTE